LAEQRREIGGEVEQILGHLEWVVAEALVRRSPSRREGLRAGWCELRRILVGEGSMDDIIASEVGPGGKADPGACRRARNRALTRHKRARDAMLAMIDALRDEHQVSEQMAQELRGILGRMLRCQRTDVCGV
jgi:hypothetical protein